jgi:hypothetical protein
MSRPDSTAAAQLDQPYVGPVWLAWIDIDGDPVRANSSGHDIVITGAADTELNGTYIGISHQLVEVSSVRVAEGGTDAVTVRLSGIPGIDDDSLAQISDPSNWRGRVARLWRIIRNEAGVQQGGVQAYYTGYMSRLALGGNAETQTISVTVESYIASITRASNRTYLDQETFDPGDLSARAAVAIANGTRDGGTNPTGGQVGGGGKAGDGWGNTIREV